jgi:glutamate racemase
MRQWDWPQLDRGETLALGVDLLGGTVEGAGMMPRFPTVLVFDSGLGGLTVFAELAAVLPDARFVYAADDAGFPYGRLGEEALIARVTQVMERLIAQYRPDIVVIACNTASTLVLPILRARFPMPFVGTVPAIKPAAALTRSGRISVLGTPGTVKRDYTRALIDAYAGGHAVTLVGAKGLAALAETHLKGAAIADETIAAEIAPCFVESDQRRTDVIVLACTHYPLLIDRFRGVAPWPVTWLDPAPAIARRAAALIGAPAGAGPAPEALVVFTSGAALTAPLKAALAARGLRRIAIAAMPLAASKLTG